MICLFNETSNCVGVMQLIDRFIMSKGKSSLQV